MTETRRQGLTVGAVGLLFALALSVPAQAAAAKPAGEKRLQRALNHLVDERGGPPGVSAMLRRANRETFITAGVADVETGRPIRTRTYMRIASVSKAFTGAVALSLVDRRDYRKAVCALLGSA
jgi:D-alanyl-D-alanine carboxypeptidase